MNFEVKKIEYNHLVKGAIQKSHDSDYINHPPEVPEVFKSLTQETYYASQQGTSDEAAGETSQLVKCQGSDLC